MRFFITTLEIVLPALYFATVWVYGKAFFAGNPRAAGLRRVLLTSTVATHLVYVVIRTILLEHFPITSFFEILSLISLTVSLVYLYIELRTDNRETGYFILMLPLFFQIISSAFIRDYIQVPPALRGNLLGFHVSSALLGYAAITISAAYGLLYLMLYHDIKSNQFGVVYKRLPDLETLERMSFAATFVGTILLTVAITLGVVWLPRAIESFSYADPKLFGTIAVWVVYVFGLVAKQAAGWKGRRMMVVTVTGFVLAVVSIAVTTILPYGFHKFGR
ncbi:MAG TPA: cytochrome c biogenesis protein CcsA [Bacteroidota bacterium]|nr:cytochrome c biogenesis protein CcsA [Bacteroidota bacterium]